MSAVTLPLFPLHTVLFPGGPLGLRIFEPRYLDLVRRCLREQSGFGVVLLTEGEEAGAATAIAAVGTEARIVDFDPLPDGMLGITCLGTRRFRVAERWQQGDGLNLARIEYLAEEPQCALPSELAHLARLLRELLPKLGRGYTHVDAHYESAGWVANRWAEVLPLSAAERLQLLEQEDPLLRLAQVAALSARQPAAAGV
ncbi:MAG: LON peptidase substrate-binding domain-containing protein [Gammaproteobacteria bacterium]|nr:LON peptidase substrate-binding domain-containing protein [Gammaproteobacteria bacterium]MBV9695574.1 LON peptidase substrate-binding domain-containing protein [Gammaproteobacteria bacterium]